MKSRLIRVTLLTGVLVTSSLTTFAGDKDARIHPTGNVTQESASQIPNQGKGAGITRSDSELQGNAWREQTAADSQSVRSEPVVRRPKWQDSAYTK